MIPVVIQYTRSAFKHGCTKADIKHAIMMPLYNDILDEYQGKYLLLGFNSSMNVLEIMYNYIDGQTIRVFHAMKCRSAFLPLLDY
jgi:hypothetical protein